MIVGEDLMAKAKPNRVRFFVNAVIRHEYTVREGETLADVLRKSGTNARELAARNPRCDLFHLQPGQRLRVPRTACPCARTYRVRRNENVYSLAHKFNRSVAALLQANPHLLPGEIQRGARIALPKE
jgi:LysM repeat protein